MSRSTRRSGIVEVNVFGFGRPIQLVVPHLRDQKVLPDAAMELLNGSVYL
jgi:hypothetical protein